MKAALVTDNKVSRVEWSELADLQKLVGGYVEVVTLNNECEVLVNENGIALGLLPNDLGTAICGYFEAGLMLGDFIKGPMVVLGPLDEAGHWTDLPEDMWDELTEFERMAKHCED